MTQRRAIGSPDARAVVAITSFSGVPANASLRAKLACLECDESAERLRIVSAKADLLERMLGHFNIEKRIFAETDLTKCLYDERTRRNEVIRLERVAFKHVSVTVLTCAGPELLVLTQAQHTRRACFIWLAQSLCRAEILHRMDAVVREELIARRNVFHRFTASLAAATTFSAAGRGGGTPGRGLREAQAAHEMELATLETLRADRARGVAAGMAHALLSAHEAARSRVIWDEELQFRQLLRMW